MAANKLEEAERDANLAQAQIAQGFGYHLCQCTFPPRIMLSIGFDQYNDERFQCSNCKKVIPPPHREVKVESDFDIFKAAAKLRQKKYYKRVQEMTTKITPDRLW